MSEPSELQKWLSLSRADVKNVLRDRVRKAQFRAFLKTANNQEVLQLIEVQTQLMSCQADYNKFFLQCYLCIHLADVEAECRDARETWMQKLRRGVTSKKYFMQRRRSRNARRKSAMQKRIIARELELRNVVAFVASCPRFVERDGDHAIITRVVRFLVG